jgi:hypothetical protein
MKKYLSLIIVIAVLIVALLLNRKALPPVLPGESPVPSVSPSPIVSSASPLDLTYIVDDEPVTLKKGTITQYADTPEEITTEVYGKPAVGDIGAGSGTNIMFLDQQTSGTGIFFYIAAAYKGSDGMYKPTKAVFIGDRIVPGTITVVNGAALVKYVTRKSSEPMSAEPSVQATKTFIIKDGELVEK